MFSSADAVTATNLLPSAECPFLCRLRCFASGNRDYTTKTSTVFLNRFLTLHRMNSAKPSSRYISWWWLLCTGTIYQFQLPLICHIRRQDGRKKGVTIGLILYPPMYTKTRSRECFLSSANLPWISRKPARETSQWINNHQIIPIGFIWDGKWHREVWRGGAWDVFTPMCTLSVNIYIVNVVIKTIWDFEGGLTTQKCTGDSRWWLIEAQGKIGRSWTRI